MADFNALQAIINAYIKRNGVQAITGQILNGVLTGMVNALGKGYTVAGAASPTTDPGTMTGPLAYIAYTAGTYTHFDNIVVEQGEVSMLIYNEAEWHKEVLFSLAAQATVDDNIGVPSVGVSFVDGILTFNFRNMKGEPGENGQDGDPAGFGTISASISGGVGTPGVSVQSSGPDTAKNIAFQFTNLKGETGVTSCVVTVDNTTGNPSCAVSLVGQELHLDFSGLKGAQGNTGSSVDYPFTIVNNLTTDDPTQALSAAMGVQLESEVSQLEAKVDDLQTGKYYGHYGTEEELPEGDVPGYAYVGEDPSAIYDFVNGEWRDSGQTVNQSPIGNDEDIDQNEGGKLQFANRVYNAQQPNGMGYKILRKDATFASQVTDTNTIYEIRYKFDLNGGTVTIPSGSILKFNGGSISNGSLANVGRVIEATIGCISATISSFANEIKVIRTSEYGVGVSSVPAYNNSVLQSAINKQIVIEIDTTNNVGFDEGITFDSPLYITKYRVWIRGVGFEGGSLYFPNGDGFVYSERLYYSHNLFDNLTISAKGYCFNFVNEETEGVVNTYRPYNIYQSVFSNIRVKSLEKDCFYQGGVQGYGGDHTMIFQTLFKNITIWTTRYGFNGIVGQTDLVVEHLTDANVPESFFYNTYPSVVRYVNSSFSGTKHFMTFGGTLTNYDIKIRCEYCSFETYTGEVFLDTALADNATRNYRISLYKCGFAYSGSTFVSGKVELFPIQLNAIREFVLKETILPSIGFEDGYGLCWTPAISLVDTDKDIDIYYGYNANTYIGYYTAKRLFSERKEIVGTYPNYLMPWETSFIKATAVMADNFGFNPETIDVTSNNSPDIHSTFVSLTATANATVNQLNPVPLSSLGGVASQTALNKFGKFILFYNDSNYTITFNNGYSNSVVALDTPFLVMKPKEFMIAVYNFAKSNNRFVVVQRMNGLVKNGNTNQRPTLTAYEAGFTFYDRTLKAMILWNGTAWTKMDGTALS